MDQETIQVEKPKTNLVASFFLLFEAALTFIVATGFASLIIWGMLFVIKDIAPFIPDLTFAHTWAMFVIWKLVWK
jgi:hypothetical protein